MTPGPPLTGARLADLLASLAEVRLLVVGDLMLDGYIWGQAERISPEAPVLVLRADRRTYVPGGAGNVVRCLRALGCGVAVCGAVGDDADGGTLERLLAVDGVEPLCLTRDSQRPTTLKTRVVAGSQQVLRIDQESTAALPDEVAQEVVRLAAGCLATCRGLLLSDYDKGVLTRETVASLIGEARARGLLVAVNAKPRLIEAYAGVDLLTVNRVEAEAITGLSPTSIATAQAAARAIGDRLRCALTLVTLGKDGAVLYELGGECTPVAPWPVQVFDVAGAGDTTVATAHAALCAGASALDAVQLAMRAAAVVVRKIGVATASPAEILAL